MGKKSRNAGTKKSNKSHKEKMLEEFKKPFDEKAYLASQNLFMVERMLGKTFNKFNLIIIKDDGQHFSSSYNFIEILNKIKNANTEYSAEYFKYIMSSSIDDKTFYACINIMDKPDIVKMHGEIIGIIDMTYYFWKE